MSFLNGEKPLGLPKGSVRAIIALAMTVAVVVAMFLNVAIPDMIFGFVAAIIGFYFGSRTEEEAPMK